MKAVRFSTLIAACLATAACATAQQPEAAPAIAITIDDLPVHGPYPRGESALTATKAILAALETEQVEAYGFLNARWTFITSISSSSTRRMFRVFEVMRVPWSGVPSAR